MKEKNNMNSPILKTENLSRTYRAGSHQVEALKGANIEIQPGDFVAVMGPSGSGKTTLLSMLGCMEKPTEGKILLDGEEVTRVSEANLYKVRRTRIGFVFQGFNLVDTLSAAENVAVPMENTVKSGKDRMHKAEVLLATVGLRERAHHRPNQLSAGEQQRVAIARALANDPAIILADEPTASLDTDTGRSIMELLRKLCADQKHTVIMVTHDPRWAEYASRKFTMRDGVISAG
jgi:putative ABC transport system ATP-binding protein